MKSLRIWLLIVLTVLLPLRGALAAAMMCPVAGVGVQAEVRVAEHAHGHAHTHTHGAGGHQAPADHASQHADHHHATTVGEATDRCNLCSAFCSVPGIVSGAAAIAEPQRAVAVFPHLRAAPASFISDGPERPPRTV